MKLMIALLAFAGLAHAGPTSSGGGAAYVCRSGGKPNGRIIKPPILYDLFEASVDPDRLYKFPRSNASADDQIRIALRKLDTFYQPTLSHALGLVRRDWTKLPNKDVGLTMASDVIPKFKMKDPRCHIELVAHYYDDSSSLFYDDEIYRALPNTQKAALKIHEAVYKLRRYFSHDTDSINTRRIVANIMMGRPMDNLSDIANLAYDLLSDSLGYGTIQSIDIAGLDLLLGGKTVTCTEQNAKAIVFQAIVRHFIGGNFGNGDFNDRYFSDTDNADKLKVPYSITADQVMLAAAPDRPNSSVTPFGYDLVKITNLAIDDGTTSPTGVVMPLSAVLEEKLDAPPVPFAMSYSYTPERGPDGIDTTLTCVAK